jgi:hypothetical protein
MRILLALIALTVLCGCATDDPVSERRSGQQLICHKGHTQAVATADYFVHQNHGDPVGPCPEDQ